MGKHYGSSPYKVGTANNAKNNETAKNMVDPY